MDVKTVRKKLFHAAQLQTQLNHLMGELILYSHTHRSTQSSILA